MYQAPVAMTHMPVVRKAPRTIWGQRTLTTSPVTMVHQSVGMMRPVHDGVADGHLHPAVVAEDPEGREQCPEGHHAAGEKIESRRDPVAPKQHDAEEGCFQEEGGEGFVAKQGAHD